MTEYKQFMVKNNMDPESDAHVVKEQFDLDQTVS